jgi:hypothetical protein
VYREKYGFFLEFWLLTNSNSFDVNLLLQSGLSHRTTRFCRTTDVEYTRIHHGISSASLKSSSISEFERCCCAQGGQYWNQMFLIKLIIWFFYLKTDQNLKHPVPSAWLRGFSRRGIDSRSTSKEEYSDVMDAAIIIHFIVSMSFLPFFVFVESPIQKDSDIVWRDIVYVT